MKETLKLALEALEESCYPRMSSKHTHQYDKSITAIKEALSQPDYHAVKTYHEGKPVYVAQPEQVPMAGDVHTEHCFQGEYKHCCKYGDGDDCTAAPKTQWNPEPEPLTVDVVYVEGDDLFICGVHGKITVVALSEIERDIKENPDFLKGDGVYSYSVTRFDGEYGFEGRCELAPCWELCESGYVPL